MPDTITVRDARAHLPELITSAEAGNPAVITRHGRPVAALISIEEFEALEEAADVLLAREAAQVLAAEGDGRNYTMAEVIADIFGEQGAA